MSVLAPSFDAVDLEPVGDWHPSRFTDTLSGTEEFTTEGDKLLRFIERHWSTAETERGTFRLDDWQRWLIRRVLETYPDDWPVAALRGQLRYRQVVISVGRQNGKSVIGAILAFYYLALHVRGPRVVGTASVESQAKIVYDRVRYAVENNPALEREIKATETRGITRRDGSGIYQTLPAKEETAQGEPISGCLYDELHLGLPALWDALVIGQRARRNSQLVGITTAGDADSLLLLRLYEEGEAAIDGKDERFGFFAWESLTEEFGKDYVPTEADVIAANPAVACGRVDLAATMSDTLKMWRAGKDKDGVTGRDRVIRYTLNRFIEGSSNAIVPIGTWRRHRSEWPGAGIGDTVYGIDRTDGWEYATITASAKVDGTLHTRIVAQVPDPDQDQLLEVCDLLAARGGAVFALDSKTLKALGTELKARGYETWTLGATEMEASAATVLAAVKRGTVKHVGDAILSAQIPRAKERRSGETWRISRTLSIGDIDAVTSTFIGLYVAEVRQERTIQLF